MYWEWELCGFSRSGDRFQKSCRRGGAAALGDEDIARFHILPAQLTQRSDFLVAHGTPGARFFTAANRRARNPRLVVPRIAEAQRQRWRAYREKRDLS